MAVANSSDIGLLGSKQYTAMVLRGEAGQTCQGHLIQRRASSQQHALRATLFERGGGSGSGTRLDARHCSPTLANHAVVSVPDK